MTKSNFRIGDKMVDAFKLGIKDTLVFLGAEKMYPLSEPIDEAIVTCNSATYNGTNQIAQNITVTLSGVTLIEDVDYVVTSNTGGTNAGDYIVTVEGIDNYEGTANGTFTINKVTPTVTAPTAKSLTYNGSAQALANVGSTNYGTLQYCSTESGTYSVSMISGTNAGNYDVWYRVVGDSNVNDVDPAKISVSIAKADPSYTAPTAKSLTYNTSAQELLNAGSTSDGTIQYSSDNISWSTTIPKGTNANTYTSYWKIIGDINHNDKPSVSISTTISPKTVNSPTITLSPSSYTYNASACEPTPTVKDGSVTISTSEYTISYSNNTNAGTATCTITDKSGGNYVVNGSKTFTIAKVTPTVTSPTPKTLTFNNANQVLANAGSTNWGTIQYCLNNSGGTYSTSVPSASAANVTYKVWYKVVGDSNINDVPPASIDCMIAEKRVTTPTITLDPTGYTYNGSECKPTPTVKDGSTVIPSSEYTTTYSNNVNAGTASVVISDKTAGNYYISGTTTFTIKKAAGSVTTQPTAKSLTYNSTDQALVTAGSGTGTMMYKLGSGSWGTSIPTSKNAGDYTVYYKASASTNYEESASGSVAVNIAKVTPTVTAPTAKSLTYNGSAQALVNAGSTNYGTLKYSTDGSTYSTSIPSGTNATSYTVYYRVDGDSNVNSVAAKTLSVTIAKADPTYSAPTAKSLTYNTSSQALLNAGAVTGGTIYYSSNNVDWSTTIPSQTNAGTYTSYWKITGDSNHNDKASASISTTISPKTVSSPTITLSQTSYTYSNSACQPTATVKDGSTTIASSEYTVSYSNNINVGTATCTITDKSGGNYTVNGSKTFTITCYSATAPTAKSLTYNTSAQTLANAGSTAYGTMVYCSTSGGTFSTTIPTGTNAGSYDVWWKVTGNTNVCNTAATKVACSIAAKTVNSPTITLSPSSYVWSNSECKPTPTVKDGSVTIAATEYTVGYSNNKAAGTATCSITDKSGGNYTVSGSKTFTISKYTPNAPTAKSLTYNGSAQTLVNAGSTNFGSIVYSTTSGGTYSTTIPTGTNAGSYEVWWKLSGDTTVTSNCNNTGATKISCSIAQAAMTYVAPKAAPRTYNGSAQQIVSGASATGGSIYYATSSAGASSSTTVPTQTNAGSYTVYWKAIPDSNHTGGTSSWASISCSIAKAAMTYSAPKAAVRTYNGSAQQIVSGASAGGGSIYYATSSAGASSSTTVPTQTNTGTTYSTYWKAVPDGNHSGGTSSWAQITGCTINKAALTITAKAQTVNYGTAITQGTGQTTTSGLVSGDALTAITLTQSTTNVPGGVITPSAGATTKGIGNYSVTYNTGTLTINKVAMTYTAPSGATRTYNGSAQQIVSGGSAGGGSIYYATSSAGASSSTTVPTKTDASTGYDVYWKAVPDSNHNGGTSSWAKITGVINKASQSAPTATGATTTYHNTATATASGGGRQGTLTWTNGSTRTATGTTKTKAYWAGNSNYNASPESNEVSLVVNKATDQSVTVTLTNRTYNTGSQVVASATAHGISNYYLGFGSSSTSAPSSWGAANSSISQTNAGTYYVWYKGTADGNHSANIGNTYKGTVTISKANISPTVSISNWTYGSTAPNPSVAGNSGSGTVVYYYKLASASSWSTTKPSAAGSYNIRADISATTNYNSGTCTNNFTINKAAMTYVAPSATTYTYANTARNAASGGSANGGSIQYCTTSGGTYSTTIPTNTNVGSYACWWKAVPDSNHNGGTSAAKLTATINCYSATAPTNKNPKWTGSAQAYANTGSTSYGTMVYCSTSGGTYSTSVPTGTAAGNYTCWYKVTGNTNVCPQTATSVSCTIAKKTGCTISFATTTITKTYGDAAFTNGITNSGDGSITWGSSNTTIATVNTSGKVTIKQAGSCTISATTTSTTNCTYSTTAASYSLTVNKAAGSVTTTPTAKNPDWTGSALALVNAGSGTGTMMYKLGSGSWGTSIPTATNAGSYTVYYKASASTNYNESASGSVSCSIKKVAMTYVAPSAATCTYNGSAQQIVSGASAGGGSIYYATSSAGASSSTTVPSQTNAGTYSTYWKAIPDSNHSGGTSSWTQITGCTINKASRTLSWTSKPNNLDKGETGTLTATPSAGSGDGSITYTSSNASVASISGSTITAKGAGTATITATIAAGTNYLSATTSYTITCTDKYNGHAYVDLGLPSGTKWATMNVGATSESGTGKYYQYGKGTTEYTYGSQTYKGVEVPLATSADTAAQAWGGSWHMPTKAQWDELLENTTFTWTTVGDVYGLKFTASNSKYVFLPAVGYKTSAVYGVGTQCQYLGSTKSWPSGAQETDYFYKLFYNIGGSPAVDEFGERTVGYPVRGVVG